MAQPKKYLNFLDIKEQSEGNERRYESLKNIMENSTFLPKPVEYKDIDAAFKDWVENGLKISYKEKILPTMVLYSNQRFTEYSQTWKYVDENKNLILNFKTITRENNPQYGKIQSGLWNIPGNRFYLMKKQIVLDDNGSESVLALKMRQPMAVDLLYKVSIYTTNFETINDFNKLVNDRFKARQDYIFPNGHAMPMTLENISDKSSYELEDRQFYSQSFDIKVMGYVLTEEDFRVEEQPLKLGVKFQHGILEKRKPEIEIEELEFDPCGEGRQLTPEEAEIEKKLGKRPKMSFMQLSIDFPRGSTAVTFETDTDFTVDNVEKCNIRKAYVSINGGITAGAESFSVKNGDTLEFIIYPANNTKTSKLLLNVHKILNVEQ